MKRKGILVIAITILLALSLTLGGCFAILNSVLNNLNDVISLLDPSVNGQNLPENAVEGSANDLAVGFDDGDLYAFWDDRGEDDVEITVVKGSTATTYDTTDDRELFGEDCFDLKGAGYAYTDDLTVKLKRINDNPDYDGSENSSEYLFTENVCEYEGLTLSEYRTYTKNVPGGFTTIDYYIASRYELFEFFAYAIIFRPDAKSGRESGATYYEVNKDIKLGYDYLGLYKEEKDVDAAGAYEAEIKCAVASFEDSASYSYTYELKRNNVGNIYLKFTYSTAPKYITETKNQYQNAVSRSDPSHYSLSTRHERTFPIDEIEQTVSVSSSDQLYFAIKKGYRPAPVSGSNADYLYRRMKAILAYINVDSYTEAKKVHNIYDYIVNTVVYDYDFTQNVINQISGSELFSYKCLYMEGVFGLTNKMTFSTDECVAICDGLSKAFLCMARIEGINAIKVSGIAMTSYGQERGAHAWNKVEVSGKWYMVDTTWGNQVSSSSSSSGGRGWIFPFYTGETDSSTTGKKNEYLSHDYCMVADDNRHDEDPWFAYPVANTAQPRLV